MKRSKLLFLLVILFFVGSGISAQRKAEYSMIEQSTTRVPKVFSTAGYTKESFNFTPEELAKIDELIQENQTKGFPKLVATHMAVEQVVYGNQVESRIALLASRAAVPDDRSVWVDRDPAIHMYTPTDLVRKVLLKSYSAADEARIQNVDFIGMNWDRISEAWTFNTYNTNGVGWHNQGVTDPQDRSLVYFQRGPAVDPAAFEFEKGLLLASGPTYSIEGPNDVFVGTVNGGVKNDGTWGTHTSTASPFDQDLQNLTTTLFAGGVAASGSILEFDFQPAIEKATFDYIFANDEYPYVGTLADVFGFFVTGPYDGPAGSGGTLTTSLPVNVKSYNKTNIAMLPDGTFVGISNINPGTPIPSRYDSPPNDKAYEWNPSYILNQNNDADHPEFFRPSWQDSLLFEYGGYSTLLTATADSLMPGKWYRLKLGVSQTNSASGGTGVFLTNLDLGNAELGYESEYMTWIPAYDSLGLNHLYTDCPQNIELNFVGNGNFKLDIFGDVALKDYVDILSLSINGKDQDISKISWGDTITRVATDTVGVLRICVRALPASLNATQGGVVSTIIGGSGDTINLSFFNQVEYDYEYNKSTALYEGKLNLDLAGGSNKLFRSLNNGLTWEFTRDTITGEYKPFSKSQIANLDDEFTILLKEPNSCWMDTIFVNTSSIPPVIQRLVMMPTISGAICDKPSGSNYVTSRENFVFTITPIGSNVGMALKVSTSRTSVPDSEGVLVVKNEDGSYTVTIKQVQESIEVYIDFTTSNAMVESHNLWTSGSNLNIESETNNNAVIYTVSGALVKSIDIAAGEIVSIQLTRGFYVVKMDNNTYKIVIK